MNTATYESIPQDVRDAFGPDDVTIDEGIPTGTIRVYRDMPVSAFVKSRRAKRKRERQNRRDGRR